jgi:ribosomal protein S14
MRWQKIYLDKRKRSLFKNFEIKLISIKTLLKFQQINQLDYKNNLLKQLYLYRKDCFFNRINNICIFTGRHSSVYRLFRVSRIELRRSANRNDIFGLRKSSW